MERILVPVDFSESATDALRFALPFARETGARLDLLHVIEPVANVGLAGEGVVSLPQAGNKQLQRAAAARLKQIAAAEVRRPMRANVFVAEGQPAPVIASIARRQQSDLVVISTHGHTGLQRLFLGSTAEAIARQSPCPVLAVRRRVLSRQGTPQSPPSERINRILVPVDFSRPSREMLIYAANFALRFRASLLLLYVIQHVNVSARIAYAATGLQMVVLNEGMTKLADWAERLVPDGVETEQFVKLLGIDVYLHFTFLLLLAFLGFVYWRATQNVDAALRGVGFIVVLFGCVVLHELGHALMARRYGIKTRDITLLAAGQFVKV